jgi:chlorobactene glucosyltransferase
LTIPHWLFETSYAFLFAGPVATLAAWCVVWYKLEQSLRTVPTLRHGQLLAAADPPTGRVCVVVPVHNEERVIAQLIRSLRAETYADFRVVLALDRCTDGTAAIAGGEIAGDPRFEIVTIDACPPDWAGKVHAVHEGVTQARGAAGAEYLLFADADTIFAPECIAASLALARARDLDLLSLLSTLQYHTWFERVVQTAAAFELMRQYPLARANAKSGRRPFANGQFMLFRRAAYDAIGGHASVKGALLEDLALARRIEAFGRNGGVFLAAGLFQCRMYASWPEFKRGWKRIYIEAANRKVKRLWVAALRIRGLGTLLPLWSIAALVGGVGLYANDSGRGGTLVALAAIALLLWLAVLLRVAQLSHAPAWTAPLHLIGSWLTGGLLDEAANDLRRNRPTRWGGRDYDLSADKA